MIENGLLTASATAPDAPINSACTDAQHAAMAAGQAGKITFVN
jgi:monothiol glutaredoxin